MIFFNRRRTSLKQEITKDPSKYWYIEKYVYGELKEIIEVPLGEEIKFTGIESGYLDDIFAGWSKISTSTTITFNAAAVYKNTTTSVKSLLDSENTIKIYAVYKYTTTIGKNFSLSGNNTTHRITIKEDATLTLTGYIQTRTLILAGGTTKRDTTGYANMSFHIFNSDGTDKEVIITGIGNNGTKTTTVVAGDYITVTTVSHMTLPSTTLGKPPADGTYGGSVSQSVSISSTGDMYYYDTTKYRVESHT